MSVAKEISKEVLALLENKYKDLFDEVLNSTLRKNGWKKGTGSEKWNDATNTDLSTTAKLTARKAVGELSDKELQELLKNNTFDHELEKTIDKNKNPRSFLVTSLVKDALTRIEDEHGKTLTPA